MIAVRHMKWQNNAFKITYPRLERTGSIRKSTFTRGNMGKIQCAWICTRALLSLLTSQGKKPPRPLGPQLHRSLHRNLGAANEFNIFQIQLDLPIAQSLLFP